MKPMVYCKTIDKGVQEFYLYHQGIDYPLYRQAYKKSNREFFANGVYVDDLGRYDRAHSFSVRQMLDKLPVVIAYVEKEYGIKVFNKSMEANKRGAYKRQRISWQDYEVA